MSDGTIVFRVDGSPDIGMGHVARCLRLAERVRATGKRNVVFISRRDPASNRLMEDKGFPVHVLDGQDPWPQTEQILKNLKPRVFFCDLPETRVDNLHPIKNRVNTLISLDNIDPRPDPSDIIIRSLPAAMEENIEGLKTRLLRGPEYLLIPTECEKLRKNLRPPNERCEDLGISMGGSDPEGLTVTVAEILLPRFQGRIHIFLGPNFKHATMLNNVIKPYGKDDRIFVYRAVPDFVNRLAECDLVVLGGGCTAFEACSIGLPVLALALEPHQEINIEWLEKRDALVNLGNFKTLDTDRFANKFNEVCGDFNLRRRLRESALAAVPTSGIQKVTEIILAEKQPSTIS